LISFITSYRTLNMLRHQHGRWARNCLCGFSAWNYEVWRFSSNGNVHNIRENL